MAVSKQEIAIRPDRYIPHCTNNAPAGLDDCADLVDDGKHCLIPVRCPYAQSLKDHTLLLSAFRVAISGPSGSFVMSERAYLTGTVSGRY
ncbi:TPA: hypothetical protein U2L33_007150 [Burkholderia cenocepacia]|nr:hypothetical protein [Burkholderia cenocepacia]